MRPVDCRPPSSSVHGILQARILVWVAIASSNTTVKGYTKQKDIKYYVKNSKHWGSGITILGCENEFELKKSTNYNNLIVRLLYIKINLIITTNQKSVIDTQQKRERNPNITLKVVIKTQRKKDCIISLLCGI